MRAMRMAPIGAAMVMTVTGCAQIVASSGNVDFRPERTRYTLRTTTTGVEVDIPFRYTNETGRSVYVVNCNRSLAMMLEKRADDGWVPAWNAVVPLCLSPPIVIRDRETYRDTLHVVAGRPSNDVHPKFLVDDIDGTYRLVWSDVLWSYDANERPFGEELPRELRTSEEFVIDDPRR